jgi:hypothetical protein
MVTGASYFIQSEKEMGIGRTGTAKLTCSKDRCGNYLRGEVVAIFELDATVEPYHAQLAVPEPRADDDEKAAFQPTVLMERACRLVEGEPGILKEDLIARIGAKSKYARIAVNLLAADGYISVEPGPGTARRHSPVKPFREEEDGHDNASEGEADGLDGDDDGLWPTA